MKKILSMLAVAAMAFTACTTDITEDGVTNVNKGGKTLEFKVEQEVSRAFMDDDVTITFENGDEFGVYIGENVKNAKGTYNNGSVVVPNVEFEATDNLMVYYPYNTYNDKRAATGIYLTNDVVQVQEKTDKVNLKHMPMVSVATTIESANGGSIMLRPAAALIKLNFYSSDAKYQGFSVDQVYFSSSKYFDVYCSNIVSGLLRGAGIDLTTVTEDSEITIDPTIKPDYTSPYGKSVTTFRAHTIFVNCTTPVTVGTSASDAGSVYLSVWPGSYGGYKMYKEGDVVTNPAILPNGDDNEVSFFQLSANKNHRFTINLTNNYECGRAMIRPFSIDLKGKTYHEQRAMASVEALRENVKTKADAGFGYVLGEKMIVIGSGAECDNIATNPMTAAAKTTNNNANTAYAQTLDGKYGFRLDFKAGENTLKRGDKIELYLSDVKVCCADRNSDTPYFYIATMTRNNIFSLESGCENEIVTKEKSIAELTADDIYTEVTLKDVEMFVKKTVQNGAAAKAAGYDEAAPFTFGLESNFKTTDALTAYNAEAMHSMMQDKDNNAIIALINPQCGDWRRNVGVPQGYGKARGVIVHETSKTIGDVADGNMGKFQFRPYDETSFSGIPAAYDTATKVIAMWSPNVGSNSVTTYYKFVCDDELSAKSKGQKSATTGYQRGGWYEKNASGNNVSTYDPNDELRAMGLVPMNKMCPTHGDLKNNTNTFLYSTNRNMIRKTIHYWYSSAKTGSVDNNDFPLGLLQGVKSRLAAKSGGGTDAKSTSPSTSIIFHSSTAGFYEWTEEGQWTGNTNGFIVEFPESAATGKTAVAFAINPSAGNLGRENWFGYPLNWKVECSIDGGNTWTACTNAITGNTEGHFDMHNFNYYINNCAYFLPGQDGTKGTATTDFNVYFAGLTPRGVMSQGYSHQKFILPESVQGAGTVKVKISPRSTQLAWPTSGVWNPALNAPAAQASKDAVHGHRYAFEDVMVTCVK